MSATALEALSPLDGRYAAKLAAVRYLFSEAGLMRERVRVECAWYLALAAGPAAPALAKLPRAARDLLTVLSNDPAGTDVPAIKQIEERVRPRPLWPSCRARPGTCSPCCRMTRRAPMCRPSSKSKRAPI